MRINIGPIQMRRRVKIGPLKIGVKKVYPELEDLEVTPTTEEQIFKSEKYGYNEVKVKGADLREDLSNELTEQDTLLTEQETTIDTIIEVLKDKAGIGIELQEKFATPSTEEQSITADEGYTGLSKVTVSGDENLIADNIKQGITIFGVEGNMAGAWDTTQIRSCRVMFLNNREMINAPYFDTSNVVNMANMFEGCENLKTVPNYNLSKVTSTYSMFLNCTNLETIGNFDTSSVNNMGSMFSNCGNEKLVIPLLNCEKVNNINNIFIMCYNLKNVLGLKNLGKRYASKSNNYSSYKLDLSDCINLTHDSLMNIINNLYDLNLTYDVANGGTLYTQQLILGSTNLAKLTSEEIQIATNKGWSVS